VSGVQAGHSEAQGRGAIGRRQARRTMTDPAGGFRGIAGRTERIECRECGQGGGRGTGFRARLDLRTLRRAADRDGRALEVQGRAKRADERRGLPGDRDWPDRYGRRNGSRRGVVRSGDEIPNAVVRRGAGRTSSDRRRRLCPWRRPSGIPLQAPPWRAARRRTRHVGRVHGGCDRGGLGRVQAGRRIDRGAQPRPPDRPTRPGDRRSAGLRCGRKPGISGRTAFSADRGRIRSGGRWFARGHGRVNGAPRHRRA
jgi:hypothetical protein